VRFFQTFEQTLDIHENKQRKTMFNFIISLPLIGLRFIETFEETADIHENK